MGSFVVFESSFDYLILVLGILGGFVDDSIRSSVIKHTGNIWFGDLRMSTLVCLVHCAKASHLAGAATSPTDLRKMHRFIALTRKATRPVGLPSLVRPVSPLASLRPLSTAVSHASPVPWRDRPITALLRDERARIADDSFAQYQLHLHPQPAHPPPATREDLVDSLVGALAIEAAATEEILFPVIQDLVGEKKTWEEDRVVSSNGTVAGKHVNNVFVGIPPAQREMFSKQRNFSFIGIRIARYRVRCAHETGMRILPTEAGDQQLLAVPSKPMNRKKLKQFETSTFRCLGSWTGD